MACEQEQSILKTGTPRYTTIGLYYVGKRPIDVRGPVTGYFYHFSPLQPLVSVDPRDAIDLLSDPQFRLAR